MSAAPAPASGEMSTPASGGTSTPASGGTSTPASGGTSTPASGGTSTLASGDVPAVTRLHRLQWEEAQQAWVLLYPEGMVKLNSSAAEILKRCDGSHNVAAIVAELEAQFKTADLRPDVESFLHIALQQNWVELA